MQATRIHNITNNYNNVAIWYHIGGTHITCNVIEIYLMSVRHAYISLEIGAHMKIISNPEIQPAAS